MSREIIPKNFREPFDLFADINHQSVCDYALYRLSSGDDIVAYLQSEYDFMARRHPEFLRRLIERGKFLEPINDQQEFIDPQMSRIRTFNAGVALGSTVLDSLAYESGVSAGEWRMLWATLPARSDFIEIEDEEKLSPTECSEIGDRLMASGQLAYELVEGQYKELFEDVCKEYPGAMQNLDIFRSIYGYVLLFGQKVIYSYSMESRLDTVVAGVVSESDLAKEGLHLVSKSERRKLRKQIRSSRSKQSSNS